MCKATSRSRSAALSLIVASVAAVTGAPHVLKTHRHPGDAWTVLHRRRHPVGERRPRPRGAAVRSIRYVLKRNQFHNERVGLMRERSSSSRVHTCTDESAEDNIPGKSAAPSSVNAGRNRSLDGLVTFSLDGDDEITAAANAKTARRFTRKSRKECSFCSWRRGLDFARTLAFDFSASDNGSDVDS